MGIALDAHLWFETALGAVLVGVTGALGDDPPRRCGGAAQLGMHLGSFTPGTRVTDFRIAPNGRVSGVVVGFVVD